MSDQPNVNVHINQQNPNITMRLNTTGNINTSINRPGGGTVIDDNIVSPIYTWSSQKISTTKMASAEVADRLSTPRIIGLSGSADGEVYFDGTDDSYIYTSIATLTNEELDALLT